MDSWTTGGPQHKLSSADDSPGSFNFSTVMVVSASPVSRVVVSRIVERTGLKSLAVGATDAVDTLRRRHPAMVILDGGTDLAEIGVELAGTRGSRGGLPLVIHLVLDKGDGEGAGRDGLDVDTVVDVSVAKPVTPDSLQPVIVRLLESRLA